uniref:Cytochrome P450 n=1 Tax=Anisakis simplex TaxID=6269 RepID=A0A0M3J4Y6_ANISI
LFQGTSIMPQMGVAIHFNEEYFENAEEFDVNRFLTEDGKLKVYAHFNPFGFGKRSCLGEGLARMELFIILVSLIQNFKFLPAYGYPDKHLVMW